MREPREAGGDSHAVADIRGLVGVKPPPRFLGIDPA